MNADYLTREVNIRMFSKASIFNNLTKDIRIEQNRKCPV
jgi:hypothetical protein